MSLHQRLLDAIEHYEGAMGTRTLVAALRAVVELHAPARYQPEICGNEVGNARWPCETIQAIARELGIEEADHG